MSPNLSLSLLRGQQKQLLIPYVYKKDLKNVKFFNKKTSDALCIIIEFFFRGTLKFLIQED